MSNVTANTAPKLRLKVSINWQVCIFTLLFLPLLIYLGFWQLQRADEKRTIQQFVEKQQALPPQPIANIRSGVDAEDAVLYRRVRGKGRFDQKHFWLIENRTYRGRNGFDVVVPFIFTSGEAILVNRGWVGGTGYRENLPQVTMPSGELEVTGQLVKPSENTLLAGEKRTTGAWPRVILQVNLAFMAQDLGRSLLPWVVHIDAESPQALKAHWAVLNMPVSKHLGYAYQWFAMAFALVILTLFANTNLGLLFKKRDYERN